MPEKKAVSQWISIGIPIFVLVAGWIATSAVQGEKIKQIESKTSAIVSDQKEINRENAIDHKAMIEALVRIETKLDDPRTGTVMRRR